MKLKKPLTGGRKISTVHFTYAEETDLERKISFILA